VELRVNPERPEVMHIDLNSAFAMTEQQANPLLRGRPVGVTNRLNDYAICIAASYEAKRLGINLGTRNGEARAIAPNFVMIESDAAKYQYVNRQMREIFGSYSPAFQMKSVDEGIIDFRGMRQLLKGRGLDDIGLEIKQRVREEVGDYMKVNVGIAPNRWLAKVAAGFMKPDGLYVIDRNNLEAVYGLMDLVELPYVKRRTQLRLNEAGIFTPLEFFRASERVLSKQVFRSINGHHWYLKLRGYETEVEYGIRTVGRSYVLEHRTADPEEIATLLYKACVKVARRLRVNNLAARGLMLSFTYTGGQTRIWGRQPGRSRLAWSERRMYKVAVRRSDQLYHRAMELFGGSPAGAELASLYITAYAVEPARTEQLALYESEDVRLERIEEAVNAVNDRYGELTVMPAAVAKSKNPMRDKIPFGTIRYFD
jgi:DNA polymerase IV